MTNHDCTMRDELTIAIEGIKSQNRWFIGIALAIIVGLVITVSTVAAKQSSNSAKIETIQNDYLPYFAFQYIVESNNKLMNLLTAIDSKDDQKYQAAVKEWSDLQQEVIKQAGKNKTRGGISIGNSYK